MNHRLKNKILFSLSATLLVLSIGFTIYTITLQSPEKAQAGFDTSLYQDQIPTQTPTENPENFDLNPDLAENPNSSSISSNQMVVNQPNPNPSVESEKMVITASTPVDSNDPEVNQVKQQRQGQITDSAVSVNLEVRAGDQ
jgi:hypothetical protein